ncbi:hypothetical protein HG531_009973 [Fusarium graminearum]|nr:hypothetical protein HG531_009973 [Fusarium graminearum]
MSSSVASTKSSSSNKAISTNISREKLVDVSATFFGAIKLLIKVHGLQSSAPVDETSSEAFLVACLCPVEEDIDFASVSKIRSIPCPAKDFQCNSLGLFCCFEARLAKLHIQNLCQGIVIKIFENKSRRKRESPTEARIDILEHLLHLVLVTEK